MPIYLVQHGKSYPKEEDPDQRLSEQGIHDTKCITEVADNYNIKVDLIVHSIKKRALQTAELFSSVLNPANGIQEIAGIKPMDDVIQFAETMNDKKNLMIVSHLPFLSKLASFLIFGNTEPAVFKFQNSGIVCMDKNSDQGSWIINWTLMPDIR
jgi:phosphohistidine phosphatase